MKLWCPLLIVVAVGVCLCGVLTRLNADSTAASVGEELPDVVATVDRIVYDKSTQSLFVRLSIDNRSAGRVFVVANDFCFKNLYGGDHCSLNITLLQDAMEIDLSHLYPTKHGIKYYRGEEGTVGCEPALIEIAAHKFVTYTFSFHFPLRLDTHVAKVDVIDDPSGVKEVSVKIGYSRESFDAFRQRELKAGMTIEEWQGKLVKEWQRTVVAKGKEKIDFGGDRGKS